MTANPRAATTGWHLPDVPITTAVTAVDRETMLEADHIATDRLGVTLLQMMENAGRELADLTRRTLDGSVADRRVVALVGTGNNAGGGLVAARRLAGWGAKVCVVFARPVMRLRPGPCAQIEPLLASGVSTAVAGHDRSFAELADEVAHADAVIDALIGYSLRGAPDEAYQTLIDLAGLARGPVLSLDVPSGIDASTGDRPGDAVAADLTLALALPKRGTLLGDGRQWAGALYLADIGIPASVFNQLGVEHTPDFSHGPLLRVHVDRG
jgi:NAD(P)H-hydrate epimerase